MNLQQGRETADYFGYIDSDTVKKIAELLGINLDAAQQITIAAGVPHIVKVTKVVSQLADGRGTE